MPATPVQRAAMDRVLADVIERRGRGEDLSDARVIERHPELMPGLLEELEGLRLLQRAIAAGQRAGAIATPLSPIPTEDIDKPILPADGAEQEMTPWRCSIPGYHIVNEISAGGQGTVYKALQETTGRSVAIKILPGGALAGSRERRRFDREAEILASLDHPNIVAILDRGRSVEGSFFFVMPYIRGLPLDEYAKEVRASEGRSGVARILRTFVKLARAVGVAHGRGIVHRDLKPSNILVDDRGEPHLLDFGLARPDRDGEEAWRVRTITGPGHVVGSLPWLSPEQLVRGGVPVAAPADVYALGVCLFQCLTGEHPYRLDGSMPEVIARIQHHAPHALEQAGQPCLTPATRTILKRCLAKRASNRYLNAQVLAEALEVALSGGRVPGPPSPAPRVHGWNRIACALALLGVVAGNGSFAPPRAGGLRSRGSSDLPTFRNAVGLTLVRVPGGPFLMGTPRGWWPRGDDERQHEVGIAQDFWVSAHEVTRGQFVAVLPDRRTGAAGADGMPITGISWQDAADFCDALGRRDGATYRLPTEAEWEYACRAGRVSSWSGTGVPNEMGWTAANSGGALHPPGQKAPNDFGLFDMQGNAAEWCADWYNPVYPSTRLDPVFRERTGHRVIRGGSYEAPDADCRCAARGHAHPDVRRADVGFRVVKVEAAASRTLPAD